MAASPALRIASAALAVLGAVLLVAGPEAAVAEARDTDEIVEQLDRELHRGAETQVLVALLEDLPAPVVREWVRGEIEHIELCEEPHWLRALRAMLATAERDDLVALLADILANADPSLLECLLLQFDEELAGVEGGSYELLVAGLGASGVLDAPEGLPADDALVRRILDQLLAPETPGPAPGAAPFINPLERETAMSKS